jgi:hypothetical protein
MPARISSSGFAVSRTRAGADSAIQIAAMRPSGTAVSMQTRLISSVPAKSGTAPKAPEAPICSARMAVCGLQVVPRRNSAGGTRAKKRSASDSSDSTMPTVVSTATTEQATRSTMITRSTACRARSCGRRWASAKASPPTAVAMAMAHRASRARPRRRR